MLSLPSIIVVVLSAALISICFALALFAAFDANTRHKTQWVLHFAALGVLGLFWIGYTATRLITSIEAAS
ncbi:hypothetical protein [Brevundimonas sp.]|uniref:hypothetical protein n=1 Tax=Brevundimonas sp. TaxID=1871086 RepID=UPI0025C0878C|nr:hypothetical protein [Brevundimonas sp.]